MKLIKSTYVLVPYHVLTTTGHSIHNIIIGKLLILWLWLLSWQLSEWLVSDEVTMLDVEVQGWCGYKGSTVVRLVGCAAKFS